MSRRAEDCAVDADMPRARRVSAPAGAGGGARDVRASDSTAWQAAPGRALSARVILRAKTGLAPPHRCCTALGPLTS